MASVDYEKAFDSVEINSVLRALQSKWIDNEYIALRSTIDIAIARAVKQGAPNSPKLFDVCLKHVFQRRLNHLRFADDIVLTGKSVAGDQDQLDAQHLSRRQQHQSVSIR